MGDNLGEMIELDKLREESRKQEKVSAKTLAEPPKMSLPTAVDVKEAFLNLLGTNMKTLLITNCDKDPKKNPYYGIRVTEKEVDYRERPKQGDIKRLILTFENEEILYNGQPATEKMTEQFYKKMRAVGKDMKNKKLFYFEEAKGEI